MTITTYVEWFSPLTAAPDPKYWMYRVSRQMCNRGWSASIIPVDRILCSALDQCQTYYVNPFCDIYVGTLHLHREIIRFYQILSPCEPLMHHRAIEQIFLTVT